ncbi:biotin synthase BioB [Marinicella sp. S1101]|uniref:biotin synthase BioB n=1 Tax=Marinicella marina TaxID=2996016 RepID=UPI002260D105|nr:biotin synthase BioB [Marinicella marina]MCX7553333.1 biotin synthase BioB [Marinicella marina]MDJ1139065.1 biotin synthase BioB [Marinicella marina]
MTKSTPIRHDWTIDEVEALFAVPFNDLLFQAQQTHREFFNPNHVQISTLLSIKTGACPEDCNYCPQSVRYDTEVEAEPLMPVDAVLEQASLAKEQGATRFCMGAAWRSPKDRDLDQVIGMVKGVKALGMETCLTLGMLSPEQSKKLSDAGLDYYNHNIDTSEEYYQKIITTRKFEMRMDTLKNVQESGINVCSGGIVGMGESQRDRGGMLMALANLDQHPGSVPINSLVQVEGTPLHGIDKIDALDFVRTIAVARIMMPKSMVRLSAGRNDMSEAVQAMCFFAGANSIFYGEKLLTTANPEENKDMALFRKLGIEPMPKNH